MVSKQKICFVICPIGAVDSDSRTRSDFLFEYIIEPVFRENYPKIKPDRSDKIVTPGMIDSKIINLLHNAELVIADMSELNANVFYEMGIRHTLRLPTIHMFRQDTKVPFDVAPYRAIEYNISTVAGINRAKTDLLPVLQEVFSEGFEVDNPVTKAIGVQQIKQSGTPIEKVLLDQLEDLRKRVENQEALRRYDPMFRPYQGAGSGVIGLGGSGAPVGVFAQGGAGGAVGRIKSFSGLLGHIKIRVRIGVAADSTPESVARNVALSIQDTAADVHWDLTEGAIEMQFDAPFGTDQQTLYATIYRTIGVDWVEFL